MLMWLDFPKNGMHRSNRHGLSWLCDSDGHWGWNLHVSYTLLRSVFWVCRNLDISHVWILHITRVVDWMLNVARVIAWHIHGLIAGLPDRGCRLEDVTPRKILRHSRRFSSPAALCHGRRCHRRREQAPFNIYVLFLACIN